MDLTVGHVEALLSVEEHGSFTRAAEALGLTQPAVSRAVAMLERRLGRTLVHRRAQGATLTAAGREVAEHGHAILRHLKMIEALGHRSAPPRLRIGAVASALVRLVPETLAVMHSELPELQVLTIQGDDDELAEWLEAGTIDLSVSTVRIGGIESARPVIDEFLAVLPAWHRLAKADRVDLADLAAAGFVDPGGTCGPILARSFAENGVAWRPEHTVREISTVVTMVSAGITAGVVPAMAAPSRLPQEVVLKPLNPTVRRQLFVHRSPHHDVADKFAKYMMTNQYQ
ncbi:LysR family transcriptional regulator [Amycolatopsis sp. EV170708-02-1]|uniref:LysR family transcriptional regulator n=1 Tax=Amycolatopsis sp. EV170708-02-1 TaxID=2919322 RepID=UPI001F0BE7E6|nr:LysR family transcriptional regulator [Amycolatopsis sp. EV170708-02-1]UMO99997.1 LysR family transcriptional regulator [Amycolatopsis sp. EV170708-02-1]